MGYRAAVTRDRAARRLALKRIVVANPSLVRWSQDDPKERGRLGIPGPASLAAPPHSIEWRTTLLLVHRKRTAYVRRARCTFMVNHASQPLRRAAAMARLRAASAVNRNEAAVAVGMLEILMTI